MGWSLFHLGQTDLFDDLFQADERSAANKQNVAGVDLDELLMRMLSASLRRNVGNRALDEFEQRLLDPFSGHVPRDRRAVAFSADLIDFIDVHDSALSPLYIVVGCLKKLQNNVFDEPRMLLNAIPGLTFKELDRSKERSLCCEGGGGRMWAEGGTEGTRNSAIRVREAVALGATVIEKHFTLDKNMPGPDHKASLEPHELKSMVLAIRNIEKAMGDGIKKPSSSELKNREIARKSIVAAGEFVFSLAEKVFIC
jgi:hypothetical protein